MKLWNVNDLAERYKIDKSNIRRLIRQGVFPNASKKKGNKGNFWVVPESDLKAFTPRKAGRQPTSLPTKKVLAARTLRQKYKFKNRPVNETEIQELVAFYERGASQTDTSIKFRLPIPHVLKILKNSGVEIRKHSNSKLFRRQMRERRKMPPKELIIELYQEKGLPRDEILARLGVSGRTLGDLLRFYEIPKRRFHAKKAA